MTLALLTPYLCGGVLGDHGVGGELGVQDAPVGVRVHRQAVQQLAVLLHTLVGWGVSLRDQRSHCLWGQGRTPHTTHSQQDPLLSASNCTSFFEYSVTMTSTKILFALGKDTFFLPKAGQTESHRRPASSCVIITESLEFLGNLHEGSRKKTMLPTTATRHCLPDIPPFLPLQHIQNAAKRLVFNLPPSAYVTPIFLTSTGSM